MAISDIDPSLIVDGPLTPYDLLYFNPTTGLYEWTNDPVYALRVGLILYADQPYLPTQPGVIGSQFFIQPTQPVGVVGPYFWIQTGLGDTGTDTAFLYSDGL